MVSKIEWMQRIKAYKNSGMSLRAWCISQGIAQSSLRFHIQKESSTKFVELKPLSRGIKIHWKNLCFEIDPDFDLKTLSRFLDALR